MAGQRRYWVGTSGWQYDHWRSRFYPHDLARKHWFSHYSGVFSCVELNNSFYRQPNNGAWDRWREEAPPGFYYAVKANRFITHMKRFLDSEEPLRRFLAGARRLGPTLGPVLFQTHPRFKCTPATLARLDAFLELIPRDIKSAFEFRDASWFQEEALEVLRRHEVAFCIEDMPGLKCPTAVTAPHAYVRLHGIGRAYEGSYSDEALRAWARVVTSLETAEEVWVFFNNDQNAYAVENARTLSAILRL